MWRISLVLGFHFTAKKYLVISTEKCFLKLIKALERWQYYILQAAAFVQSAFNLDVDHISSIPLNKLNTTEAAGFS